MDWKEPMKPRKMLMTAMTGNFVTTDFYTHFNFDLLDVSIVIPANWAKFIQPFSDSATDDDDGDGEAEILDSDEDEIDEGGAQYLEKLESRINKSSNGTIEASIEDDSDSDDSDDEDYDGYEETSLESYTTPLDEEETNVDEYQVFKEVRAIFWWIIK